MVEVRVGAVLAAAITREFGPERTAEGRPSEWDFWAGRLGVALVCLSDSATTQPIDLGVIAHGLFTSGNTLV